MNKTIGLITDFGLKDWYVAELKLRIKSLCDADIIDISHKVGKFNIDEAKFLLLQADRIMPEHSVTIAVIDPGVGGKRNSLVFKKNNKYFIGPDNGIFDFILEGADECRLINVDAFNKPSRTFHGRDIFAPIAVKIIRGEEITKYTNSVECPHIGMKKPFVKDNVLIGEVIYTDSFGNAITNIDDSRYEYVKEGNIFVMGRKISFTDYYSESIQISALFNSGGLLEICSYKSGNRMEIKSGEIVEVRRRM